MEGMLTRRMCRECIRLPENREKVRLNIRRNDFIFSVESTGCVPAEQLLPKVILLTLFHVGLESDPGKVCHYCEGSGDD